MLKVRDEIQTMLTMIRENRRHLHMYPEIELNTPQTKAYLIEQLKNIKSLVIEEGYAINGFVAYLKVNDKNSCVAFRSDMDALPIQEENDWEYKSKYEGYSHACGHDGHMSILLATIRYLAKHKEALSENVLFIFQPGEEEPGGASLMIKDGLFKKYPIRCIFGTHVNADLAAGLISCAGGPLMARNGEISIDIYGQSAHGALAYQGVDAMVAASAMVMQLQTIVSRSIDPLESTVLTLGMIQGGQARNVICDHVNMEGTMRSFHDESYELQKQRIQDIAKGIEQSFQVRVEACVNDYYQVVNNDVHLDELLQKATKDSYVKQKPMMIAEDFSFYQKEVPGLFYYTGVRDEEHTRGIHDCKFNFDETSLLNAVETNIRLLEIMEILHD